MKYVKECEGLRGLMALWVVLGHWCMTVDLPGHVWRTAFFDNYAVDVFIILSGFAIATLIGKRPENYRAYITRRFLRIFPVYLLFLALSVALTGFALKTWQNAPASFAKANLIQVAQDSLAFWPEQLIAHLTALHGAIPPQLLPSTGYAFLGQAWSISLEWQFYLVAPFLLALLARLTPLRLAACLVIAVLLIVTYRFMGEGYLGSYLHLFLIGIGSAWLLKARAEGRAPFNVGAAWIGIVLFCLLLKSPKALPYLIWVTVIASVIAVREGGTWGALVSRPLASPLVLWLGRMSYSIYLSHMLVLVAAIRLVEVFPISNPEERAVVLLAMLVPGTILLSWGSYLAVEKPFHEMGKRLRFDRSAARFTLTQPSS